MYLYLDPVLERRDSNTVEHHSYPYLGRHPRYDRYFLTDTRDAKGNLEGTAVGNIIRYLPGMYLAVALRS